VLLAGPRPGRGHAAASPRGRQGRAAHGLTPAPACGRSSRGTSRVITDTRILRTATWATCRPASVRGPHHRRCAHRGQASSPRRPSQAWPIQPTGSHSTTESGSHFAASSARPSGSSRPARRRLRMPFTVAETVGRGGPSLPSARQPGQAEDSRHCGPRPLDIASAEHRLVTEKFIAACSNGDQRPARRYRLPMPGAMSISAPGSPDSLSR
jgi:hypothetical protein